MRVKIVHVMREHGPVLITNYCIPLEIVLGRLASVFNNDLIG